MDGKTALVTGASSGIGRAIAQRFADDGARVYLTGRRKDELEAVAEDIGPGAVSVPCDVSQAADLDQVMDVIRGDGRRLDVVVANAGLGDGPPAGRHGGAVRLRLRGEHQGQPADRAEVAALLASPRR